MKTREEIITGMCYTWRHDYGLEKHPEEFLPTGMNDIERRILWDKMAQIFDNDIAPCMKFKKSNK